MWARQSPNLAHPSPPPDPLLQKYRTSKQGTSSGSVATVSYVATEDLPQSDRTVLIMPVLQPVGEELDPEKVERIQMIMQMLYCMGLSDLRSQLIQESGIKPKRFNQPPEELYDLIKWSLDVKVDQVPIKKGFWKELDPLKKDASYDRDTKGVRAGTISRLIECLSSHERYDKEFMQAFLMTHKSFAGSEEVMTLLLERYQVPNNMFEDEATRLIKLRVCNVLKTWIDNHFSDFSTEMVHQLFRFIEEVIARDPTFEKMAQQLKESLQDKIGQGNRGMAKSALLVDHAKEVPKNFWEIDPADLAQQLTLIEFSLYQRIRHDEFLDAKWSVPKSKHLSPNLNVFAERFNHVSFWVKSIILSAPMDNRPKILTVLLKAEEVLRSLNNFNTLMGFVSALGSSSILRLHRSWAQVAEPLKETHESISSMMKDIQQYKETAQRTTPPLIPFIGPFLTDVVFIEDGNPDQLDGLINIYKKIMLYRTIRLVLRGQSTPYNLIKSTKLHNYLFLLKEELSEENIDKLAEKVRGEEMLDKIS
eukprot:TRINITY_DN6168_c0_g1_i4.p1 TRINITY_DN6168_c0_g1~~TRINITY_DN6168_c0_g1_i4.p1  ORF type:complete len:533 (+),score=88.47 TRINITY_DN6168_c0_g1_i4:12-1610(+)